MPYFVDLVKTSNVDCVFDEIVELKKTDDNIACVAPTLANALVFSIASGVYTITNAQLTSAFFSVGDRVIIRGSVDSTGLINNDGVYTIVTNPEGSVTVKEPVKAATSLLTTKAGGLGIDEYATFILHPNKHSGKMAIWLNAVTNLAEFNVSLVPGGYWYANKPEVGLPTYQGSGVTAKTYLLQIETAKYLQTEEGDLAVDGTPSNDIEKQGTILVRIFPGVVGDPLLVDEIELTFIMLD